VISISGSKNGFTFRNVVAGLLGNSQLDPVLCLLFIFGILTDRIHFNNKEQQGAMPTTSVADPGSGAFLTPASVIRDG
jgi:hypothetical protein